MITKTLVAKSLMLIIIIIMVSTTTITSSHISPTRQNCNNSIKHTNLVDYSKVTYEVQTEDKSTVTLTRYIGCKRPSIMLVHGMGVNHKIFDWDENHSFARFLNDDGWDVWMLDLRTHDGDGDFILKRNSDREYINRYWDFDNTLLKQDCVKAVDFIKNESGNDTIYFMGHSYGGYLAYAYAELIGEENLSGIITTGSSAMSTQMDVPFYKYLKYGIKIGNKVFVNPFGLPRNHMSYFRILKFIRIFANRSNGIFYGNTTSAYIKKEFMLSCDDEPAGVCVDMLFGKHPRLYNGHWVDPQTLYDYTANLHKITVPSFFLVGDEDTDDPMEDVYKTYENVSSEDKKFLHFPNHGHLDLLLGENSSNLIFPEVTDWLNSVS